MRNRKEEEPVINETLAIPCYIGSFAGLRGKEGGPLLVKLFLPYNGIAIWADHEDVKILEQQASDISQYGLKAELVGKVVTEHEGVYLVEVMDWSQEKRLRVPKDWLASEKRKREKE